MFLSHFLWDNRDGCYVKSYFLICLTKILANQPYFCLKSFAGFVIGRVEFMVGKIAVNFSKSFL